MALSVLQPSPKGVPGAVTDTSGLLAEELTYAGFESDPVDGFLVRPADGAGPHPPPYPAMIVIHEAGGLRDHIRDVVGRFANLGYVALGVDLYTREGGPPAMDDMQTVMARLFSMPDDRALGDLEGAADFLRARPDVDGRLGCIGFCMGGRYTLLFAAASDRLDAAVDCWGGFIDSATPEQRTTEQRPTPPLEIADRLSCPLMAAIGAQDHNPSPQLGEQLRKRAASGEHEVVVDVYENAGHAFFADYRPSYRPEPAAKLWERVVPFLARHLQDA